MYAAPPANTDTFAGATSESGTTVSGYFPSRTVQFELPQRFGKTLRQFQLGCRKRASVTPETSSEKTDVAQSRIDVMYVLPKTRERFCWPVVVLFTSNDHVSASELPR